MLFIVASGACGNEAKIDRQLPTETLLSAEAEWDDIEGPDVIVLSKDGRLSDGDTSGQAELTHPMDHFFKKQASLEVVELGHGKYPSAILVTLPTSESEDPPNRYQLFVREAQELRRVLDLTLGTYGVTKLDFPGDGTAVYVEDGWTACNRPGGSLTAMTVSQERVTLGFRDGVMSEAGREPSGTDQECDELAG